MNDFLPTDLASAYAYCEAQLRAEDHDAWLAALFAPVEFRPRLYALGAFALEIGRVRGRVKQAIAGEIRLQWWQDVIDGKRATEATAHPVAAALLDTIRRATLPAVPIGDMLDGLRMALYDEPPADLAAFERQLATTQGTPIRLAARALGSGGGIDPAADEAGVALGALDLLRQLRSGSGHHPVLLPTDLLAWHGASQADVDTRQETPAVKAAVAEIRVLARSRLADLRRRRGTLGPAGPAFLTTALVSPQLAAADRAADAFAPLPELPRWRRQWRLWRASRQGGLL